MDWEKAQALFPKALVLGPPDGFSPYKTTYQAHRNRYPPTGSDRLVLRLGEEQASYSLKELKESHVHHRSMGKTPMVVFSENNTFGAFVSRAGDQHLTFEKDEYDPKRQAWLYRDRETQSRWVGLRGEAIEGPLKGMQLIPVVSFQLPRWTWEHLYGT